MRMRRMIQMWMSMQFEQEENVEVKLNFFMQNMNK